MTPDRQIAIIWSIEDVQTDDVRPDLTDEEALEVLRYAERNHDANYGINWDTLKITADDTYSEGFERNFSLGIIQEMLGKPLSNNLKSEEGICFFQYSNDYYSLSCHPEITERDGILYVSDNPRYEMTKYMEGEWIVLDKNIDVAKVLNGKQIDITNAECYKDFMPVVRELFERLIADYEAVGQTRIF